MADIIMGSEISLDELQGVPVYTGQMNTPFGEECSAIIMRSGQGAIIVERDNRNVFFKIANDDMEIFLDGSGEEGGVLFGVLMHIFQSRGKFWDSVRETILLAPMVAHEAKKIGLVDDSANIDNFDFKGLVQALRTAREK